MTDTILCLNAGSSSIKFKVLEAADTDDLSVTFSDQLEGIGVKPRLTAERARGEPLVDQRFRAEEMANVGAAVPKLLQWLGQQLAGQLPTVIGCDSVARAMPPRCRSTTRSWATCSHWYSSRRCICPTSWHRSRPFDSTFPTSGRWRCSTRVSTAVTRS